MHFTLAVFVPKACCESSETVVAFIEGPFYSWLDQHKPEGNSLWFDGLHLVEMHTPERAPQEIIPSAYFSLEGGWQELADETQQRLLEAWTHQWFEHVEAGRDRYGLNLYFDCHR